MKKLISFCCICTVLLFGQEPHWVKNRPVSDKYIIGIGYADKKTKDYRAVARANAQGEIASTISVNISSELIDIMTEYSGNTEEYTRSEIIASTNLEVEGIELVDDHEDGNGYWIYMRLPYETFKRYAENAINIYDDYLFSEENDLTGRLELLVPCLEYIYRAVGYDVYHESKIGRTDLRVEVPLLIKSIVAEIHISSSKDRLEAFYGRGMDEPIDISVRNRLNNRPMATGMEIFFHRGDGQFLVNKLKADSQGRSSAEITQINSKREEQVVKIAIDLTRYKANINQGKYFDNLLKGMAREYALTIGIKVSEFRKDKVGILVVGEGISSILLSSLMSKFNYEFKRQTDFDIMDPRDVEAILEREGYRIEPCTSYECQVEMGKKLGVDNLIFIKIVYLRTVKLINVSTVFSEIYTKRVAHSTDLDLPVKKNQSADEVIVENVPNVVDHFWNSFNPGKLIVNSSIPNVNVEISNDSNLKDRPEVRNTNFKIELAPGLYNLHFEKLGYLNRNEQIKIVKSDQREITIELTRKTAFSAFLRSAIIPGSGQYYSADAQNTGRAKMGRIIRYSMLAGIIFSSYAWYSFDQSNADYQAAKEIYESQITLEDINAKRKIAEDKNQIMLGKQNIFYAALGLAGVIWTGNVLDAFINFPDYGYSFSTNTNLHYYDNNELIIEPTITLTYNF